MESVTPVNKVWPGLDMLYSDTSPRDRGKPQA